MISSSLLERVIKSIPNDYIFNLQMKVTFGHKKAINNVWHTVAKYTYTPGPPTPKLAAGCPNPIKQAP
jgi:hypothetical protein